jgi:hypothetical protein
MQAALDAYVDDLNENEALDPWMREQRAAMWRTMLECFGAFGLMVRGNIGAATVIDARHSNEGDWWLVTDNGGELNVYRINHDTGRSVPCTAFRSMLDGGTMAYRVRCVVDDDAVDYSRSYADALETLRAHQGPNNH